MRPYTDNNGPLLRGDPLLDRPDLPPPGWFGAVEFDLLKPIIRNRLVQTVNVAGIFTDTVHLPSASLNWRRAFARRLATACPKGPDPSWSLTWA